MGTVIPEPLPSGGSGPSFTVFRWIPRPKTVKAGTVSPEFFGIRKP
ncbi:MAG: hypothetical protein RIT19_1019 [Verrucomicrobiota bacterium]|jgi:hypothetical protein